LFDVAPLEKNFSRKVILPGSFNPLHDGHLRLLEVASRFVFSLWSYESKIAFLPFDFIVQKISKKNKI